jgi:hypothetical protein
MLALSEVAADFLPRRFQIATEAKTESASGQPNGKPGAPSSSA